MVSRHDAEFTSYLQGSLPWLRRVAFMLCQDWQAGDDLVQVAATRLYARWPRVRRVGNLDAYVRVILVREFLRERQSGWSRFVSLPGELPDGAARQDDSDTVLDIGRALAALPPRQRAVMTLRFCCDMSIEQVASAMGCSTGTVKSQTSKAASALRKSLSAVPAPSVAAGADARRGGRSGHDKGA